jgi:hypothetical protein
MKTNKTLGAALASVMAAGLLLSTSAAQADTVTLDASDNVLSIQNLELFFDNSDFDGFYNIGFVTDTGDNQYGEDPVFDVPNPEEALIILPQIIAALNRNNPVPVGASSAGSDQFFIPAFEFGNAYVAVGGEKNGVWDQCSTDCVFGVALLDPQDLSTFARVSPVPVPAAVWLFGSGLLGLVGVARSKPATSV